MGGTIISGGKKLWEASDDWYCLQDGNIQMRTSWEALADRVIGDPSDWSEVKPDPTTKPTTHKDCIGKWDMVIDKEK